MNEKNKAINRAKYKKKEAPAPTKTATLEDEEETKQLSVVEQFKKLQQEQHQTLLQKLQQKYK